MVEDWYFILRIIEQGIDWGCIAPKLEPIYDWLNSVR